MRTRKGRRLALAPVVAVVGLIGAVVWVGRQTLLSTICQADGSRCMKKGAR